MADPLRAVLVGVGGIARSAHLPAVRALAGAVELVAVTDIDGHQAARFAAEHRVPRVHADLTTMLDKETPDLVLVATPSATHAAIAVECLDAGASVYCEKPLCASLAEHDAILAAERRSAGWCVPVFQWRSGSAARHLRDLLAAGSLGRSLLALCHTLWYRGPDYYAVPWRGRRDTEIGGATTTQGIHAIDLLLWLLPDWEEVSRARHPRSAAGDGGRLDRPRPVRLRRAGRPGEQRALACPDQQPAAGLSAGHRAAGAPLPVQQRRLDVRAGARAGRPVGPADGRTRLT
ncbi:Gfo/Idh/MocA family protein [Planotetraspora mira]|uniref:Gfo/Idh/MocA family oxidoreductase n=1 Tax=Planotetraspora mira TaxID=58121 RepID=A0A8J3TTF6_9ACTN|nr:Gfo/Idh/MocA family oxidoreductase [Planotetraspora mira]GII31869.1 hypothetical protein Pmi06nite_53110 [Planotetraspora mira]